MKNNVKILYNIPQLKYLIYNGDVNDEQYD